MNKSSIRILEEDIFPQHQVPKHIRKSFLESLETLLEIGATPINAEHAETIQYNDKVLVRFLTICLRHNIKLDFRKATENTVLASFNHPIK